MMPVREREREREGERERERERGWVSMLVTPLTTCVLVKTRCTFKKYSSMKSTGYAHR